MQNLLSLVYLSRAKASFDLESVRAMLASARQKNGARQITGILCTGRGCFLQALEGPENAVIKLYATILEDDRHDEVQLLGIRLTKQRHFSQWAMAHLEGAALEEHKYLLLLNEALTVDDSAQTARTLKTALEKLRGA